ncbi:Prokaryotic membrane lipoprotein lipid attachment site profile [Desulfitobacterium hafniense]|uniref:Prokaryotic membrane lipoprotein lipid attachment site profile n=1 Tax=Desulfitobacterium hafniense TaxID=49338 RepID=A0A098B995_DESHA|nr:tetratricopeptide repeat protein [Desulfitobacterium hafniense]CDX04945.1 Prokaryotic membrane lipoprotein lipid attachment site profile [Desulfitobacterium hafniense]
MKRKYLVMILSVIFAFLMIISCAKSEKALTATELLDLGEKYLLEMNYEQAVVQFTKLIEIEPKNPRGYTGLAEAYLGLGDIDKIIAILEQGLEQLPDHETLKALLEASKKKILDESALLASVDYMILTAILQGSELKWLSHIFNDADGDGKEELFLNVPIKELGRNVQYVFDSNDTSIGINTATGAAGNSKWVYDPSADKVYLAKTYGSIGRLSYQLFRWKGENWDIFASSDRVKDNDNWDGGKIDYITLESYWEGEQLSSEQYHGRIKTLIEIDQLNSDSSEIMNVQIEYPDTEKVINILNDYFETLHCNAGRISNNIDDDEDQETVFLLNNFSQQWCSRVFSDQNWGSELFVNSLDSGLILVVLDPKNSGVVLRAVSVWEQPQAIDSFKVDSGKIIMENPFFKFICEYSDVDNNVDRSCITLDTQFKTGFGSY